LVQPLHKKSLIATAELPHKNLNTKIHEAVSPPAILHDWATCLPRLHEEQIGEQGTKQNILIKETGNKKRIKKTKYRVV
jgi:hypothetical protein